MIFQLKQTFKELFRCDKKNIITSIKWLVLVLTLKLYGQHFLVYLDLTASIHEKVSNQPKAYKTFKGCWPLCTRRWRAGVGHSYFLRSTCNTGFIGCVVDNCQRTLLAWIRNL